jgi:hypothetical protein
MIKKLHLHQIGPLPDLEVGFGPRLNLVTGDNGLGKTFLLDACWYALTRTWADGKQFYPLPTVPKKEAPFIQYTIIGKTGREAGNTANYRFSDQSWRGQQARPPMPGLVVYARIDGGFSVWDPARNYWREGDDGPARPASFQFSQKDVWEGLDVESEGQKKSICNGFLRDVETWQLKKNGAFHLLEGVLEALSPSREEILSIGPGVRVQIDDQKDIPTLKMPYDLVPVTQAGAGMRRVLALAYLLVWAWEEHRLVCELQKESPTNRFVLLFDEVEAHLHPKWQRVFLPALMKVVDGLLVKGQVESTAKDSSKSLDQKANLALKKIPRSFQIMATTHAPLVLASAETVWRDDTDKLFDFNLDTHGKVLFNEILFAKHGSIVNWLESESFDSTPAFSVAAKDAMDHADDFMRDHPDPATAPLAAKEKIHHELKAALGGDDEYWPLWLPYYEHKKANA